MSNRMGVVGRGHEVMSRYSALLLAVFCATAAPSVVSTAAAQARASDAEWEVPRTPDGHPDLQGNWTNLTLTPFERPEDQESPVLTREEVQERQGYAADLYVRRLQPSDPDRPAPPPGEVSRCRPSLESPTGSRLTTAGCGYNVVYFERGLSVAFVNGEFRSSLLTNPSDGRRPALTPEGERRVAAYRATREPFEQYDHPELRPLAERCLLFGGPGPPILPNGAYNSNYRIVQTADHVMIMSEMIHDARIIRIGEPHPIPEDVRPWFGDSWGRWEGDALVVETTNINPKQSLRGVPPSKDMRVTERFTRVDEETILYEFTVDDPTTYSSPWGGEIPFKPLNNRVYEYACQEGNYALSAVLSGARYKERMEAQGSSDSRRD